MSEHTEGPRAPAGWYPDPEDATRKRYWDGTAWTDLPAPPAAEALTAPPAPPAAEAPTMPVVPPSNEGPIAPPVPPDAVASTDDPGRTARARRGRHRAQLAAFVAVMIVFGAIAFGIAGRSDDDKKASPGPFTTTTRHVTTTEDTSLPSTTEDTYTPTTTPDTVEPGGGGALTADDLVSMVGRPVTDDELSILADMCYRSFEFNQDVHCEGAAGFGLSFDNGAVRELYLYDYYPPDQVSFAGELPGGVTWDSTLADVTSTIGEPDCIDTIIGYNLHYTSEDGALDYEYTVDSDGEPSADLYKITVRPSADRPSSCH